MFAFGNDYGGLYGNVLATQQADANNYWRFADASRQAGQDEFGQALAQARLQAEAEDRARQMAQFQFTKGLDLQRLDLAKAAEARAVQGESRLERGEAAGEARAKRQLDLQEKEFDWKKELPTPSQERDSIELFRSARELADQGALNKEDVADMPDDHQTFLLAHNERAKKILSGQKSKLDDAANTLNRIIALDYDIKQSKLGVPGYWASRVPLPGFRDRYNQRQRMLDETIPDKEAELEQLQKAAASVTPEIKSHLRMNDHGFWQPNFELPWAAVAGAGAGPAVTSGTGSGGELTADVAQQFLRQAGGDKNAARQMARQAGYSF